MQNTISQKMIKKMSFTFIVMSLFFSLFFVNKVFASESIVGFVLTTPNWASTTISTVMATSGTSIYHNGWTDISEISEINTEYNYIIGTPSVYYQGGGPDWYDVSVLSDGNYVAYGDGGILFSVTSGVVSFSSVVPMSLQSGVNLTNPNAQTYANNPITFAGSYINTLTYNKIQFQVNHNLGEIFYYNYDITLANGVFNFSENVVLPYNGNYTTKARLYDTSSSTNYVYSDWSGLVSFGLNSIELQQGSTTAELALDYWSEKQRIYNLTGNSATSTIADTYNSASCMPFASAYPYFNLEFSPFNCLGYLFVPTDRDMAILVYDLKTGLEDVFPIGYFTQLYSIMSTTSTSSLVLFDLTVPSGIPGSGSTMQLNFYRILDPFLYATSSYIASSTETLYSKTNYYWQIFVWLSVAFYFINRIIRINKQQHLE